MASSSPKSKVTSVSPAGSSDSIVNDELVVPVVTELPVIDPITSKLPSINKSSSPTITAVAAAVLSPITL